MDCHICSKIAETFIDEKTNMRYHHCKSCGYIFKSPECYQDFNVQKERYDLHTNDETDEGYIAYFQRFMDFAYPFVSSCENALDFGCGESSILSEMFEEKGIPCDFYDPIYYPDGMDEAKKYDLIVSTEVFEHLHQPKEVFQSLLARLKKGGYLALQTQFHKNDREAFKKWYYHHDSTHIVFFTVKTFKVLCIIYSCELVSDNGKNMLLIRKA